MTLYTFLGEASHYISVHREPEYVDNQFQCDPLDVVVQVVLPGSPLCSLLAEVSAAGVVALIQVKVYLQGLTPAAKHSHCISK